jgi:hypothetical protein
MGTQESPRSWLVKQFESRLDHQLRGRCFSDFPQIPLQTGRLSLPLNPHFITYVLIVNDFTTSAIPVTGREGP